MRDDRIIIACDLGLPFRQNVVRWVGRRARDTSFIGGEEYSHSPLVVGFAGSSSATLFGVVFIVLIHGGYYNTGIDIQRQVQFQRGKVIAWMRTLGDFSVCW